MCPRANRRCPPISVVIFFSIGAHSHSGLAIKSPSQIYLICPNAATGLLAGPAGWVALYSRLHRRTNTQKASWSAQVHYPLKPVGCSCNMSHAFPYSDAHRL
ncbi:hypothetical protein C8R46DRAFT_343045 [Mycena filopes]|nr:hypothetical protein C8R46DRAFT_343045 [Mycena filopes]